MKGQRAFYIDTYHQQNPPPNPGSAFSITLPARLFRPRKDINIKKMSAVGQALVYWHAIWKEKRVICHVVYRAVFHGLENRTMRGTIMDVVPQCSLLATEYNLGIQSRWIPTGNNPLADALSRFYSNSVANLARQLIYPTFNHRDHGLLTSNNQHCHHYLPTIHGED